MVKESTNTQYSYIISGNGIQNGNPSPSNILPFDGCGDKTDNLFDKTNDIVGFYIASGTGKWTQTSSTSRSVLVRCQPNTTYTIYVPTNRTLRGVYFNEYPIAGNNGSGLVDNTTDSYINKSLTITTGDSAQYIAFFCYNSSQEATEYDEATYFSQVMLNTGSQSLPYKPYGYVLPIEYGGSENLFDKDSAYYAGAYNNVYTISGLDTSQQYTCSTSLERITGAQAACIYFSQTTNITSATNGVWSGESKTFTPNENGELFIHIRNTAASGAPAVATDVISGAVTVMLNKGSIPLPYVPYTPTLTSSIYLGQVQTTRNIKKLVLTGEEDWNMPYTSIFRLNLNGYLRDATNIVVCTHYKGIAPVSTVDDIGMNETALLLSSSGNNYFYIHDSKTNISTFTTYLQRQYAAGTPVTVWYVLATPEVSITNEPLMKIGSYVDTINNTQSGIDITTNNLTVNTTIPPSDISINTSATWVPIPYNKYNIETISTIAPIDFLSNGQDITVEVKGNTEQLEIPSPQNPVMPKGTGEKTENLFDKTFASGYNLSSNGNPTDYQGDSRCATLEAIDVSNVNDVTFSFVNTASGMKNFIYSLFNGSSLVTRVAGGQSGDTIDVSLGDKLYLCVYSNLASVNAAETTTNIMLNEGSTAFSYEPYGYVINIINNTVSNSVYLGEVQSTRKIRKLVLTGDETWTQRNAGEGGSIKRVSTPLTPQSQYAQVYDVGICSHYIYNYANEDGNCYVGSDKNVLYFCDNINAVDTTTWKDYLKQQYQNGTPVTVWYVLATPTTSIVNEPLMRIGDYVDEISNITIPTTKGSNTLSINTSVQPSNVHLSISGWVPHNNIKEYKNNAWMATSWEGFRDIVRAGNGPTRYPIGTELYETWGDNTSNAIIIAGYNDFFDPDITAQGYTNSVTLISEKFIPSMAFDAVEAMMYVTTEMPPGAYKFTIPNYDAPYGGDKTYYFETTKVVPVGGHICLEWRYQTVPRTIRTYASATSTTVLDSYGTQANPLPEWDSSVTATDLGAVSMGTAVTTGTYGIFNHIHRARYGSNNYYQSKLRQYMNSGASAGNWWKPMTIFDRPMDFYNNGPNPASVAGYLSAINSDFKSVLAAPSIPCMTNNTFEVGTIAGTPFARQTAYTVRDKVFLLSHTEVNLSASPTVGSTLALYTNATDADRIKYNKNTGNAGPWWLRVSIPSYASNFRYVRSSGALNVNYAYFGYGLAPAYTIQ